MGEDRAMDKAIIFDTEWDEKLRALLEATGEVGICVKYKALGAMLLASGCQLQVDERKILTIPPPAAPLGRNGSALELELPDLAEPSAHYYHFENERGEVYLSVVYLITHFPENYARLELATTPELLDAEANSPLIH